jgi:hypothetical protein
MLISRNRRKALSEVIPTAPGGIAAPQQSDKKYVVRIGRIR